VIQPVKLRRPPRPRTCRGMVWALPVILVPAIVAGCGGAPATTGPESGFASGTPSRVASATATVSGQQAVDLDAVASLKVDLERGTDWPTELDGSLWILEPDVGEPLVLRLDPETGGKQATIPVGGRLCQGIIAAFDALWACSDRGMVRIDPRTNAVTARIRYASPRAFGRPAASDDAIWALAGDVVPTSVVRIDPRTNRVTATYRLGHTAGNLAFGSGAVWISSPMDGLLLRLDPRTGKITVAVDDLPAPTVVATGQGGVFVILYGTEDGPAANGEPALLRYDPRNDRQQRIDIGSSPSDSGDVVTDRGAVWVRGSDPLIVRVDAATGAVDRAVRGLGLGDGALGIAFGSLWVTAVDRGTLWRLDVGGS
jgi:streptogramin lyase